MENKKEEIWKDIEWSNGAYQVSSLGRVRTLDRYVITKTGKRIFCNEQILQK